MDPCRYLFCPLGGTQVSTHPLHRSFVDNSGSRTLPSPLSRLSAHITPDRTLFLRGRRGTVLPLLECTSRTPESRGPSRVVHVSGTPSSRHRPVAPGPVRPEHVLPLSTPKGRIGDPFRKVVPGISPRKTTHYQPRSLHLRSSGSRHPTRINPFRYGRDPCDASSQVLSVSDPFDPSRSETWSDDPTQLFHQSGPSRRSQDASRSLQTGRTHSPFTVVPTTIDTIRVSQRAYLTRTLGGLLEQFYGSD